MSFLNSTFWGNPYPACVKLLARAEWKGVRLFFRTKGALIAIAYIIQHGGRKGEGREGGS